MTRTHIAAPGTSRTITRCVREGSMGHCFTCTALAAIRMGLRSIEMLGSNMTNLQCQVNTDLSRSKLLKYTSQRLDAEVDRAAVPGVPPGGWDDGAIGIVTGAEDVEGTGSPGGGTTAAGGLGSGFCTLFSPG